jgi:hypothetical protein
MAACEDIGPVPEEYISKDVMSRTVRTQFIGKTPFRLDVVRILKDFGYKHKTHGLEALYQKDSNREFYGVFNSSSSAYEFSQLGQVTVDNYSVSFSDVSAERIQLRVHWMPMYVSNEYIRRVFSQLGSVIRVVSETVAVDGIKVYTGVRTVTMEMDERNKVNIPHRLNTSDGYRMLITCKGRLPLCLRCNHLGHYRSDCPVGREQRRGPSTYAQVAAEVVRVDSEEEGSSEKVPPSKPVEKVPEVAEPVSIEKAVIPDSQEDLAEEFLLHCPQPEYYTRKLEGSDIPCGQPRKKQKQDTSIFDTDEENELEVEEEVERDDTLMDTGQSEDKT